MKRSGIKRSPSGSQLRRTGFKTPDAGRKPLKRTRLATESKTQARRRREYTKQRADHFDDMNKQDVTGTGVTCEHRFPGCDGQAVDIDHNLRRSHSKAGVTDRSNFIRTCRSCHDYRDRELTKEQRRTLGLGIYSEPARTGDSA